jgi:cytochrome c2
LLEGATGASDTHRCGKIVAGKRSFQKCYACHSLEGPDPATQGPSLKGIVGRTVASGNEMGFFGIRDPDERGALMIFLSAH